MSKQVSRREYLTSRGWTIVADIHMSSRKNVIYWTHPDHQPLRHGYFTTTAAFDHQQACDHHGWCKCIPSSAHGPTLSIPNLKIALKVLEDQGVKSLNPNKIHLKL